MMTETVWQGEYYSKHSHVQEKWHQAVLSTSVTFRGDERVLDIGCGDGRFTHHYSSLVPAGKVLGIDSSPSMIEWAKRRYGEVGNLTFKIEDAMYFSFKREFDWIFSTNCLHWVPDHRLVIHQIAQALKPQGSFVLLFCASDNSSRPIHQAIEETIASKRWRSYFVDFGQTSFSYSHEEYKWWAMDARIPFFTTTRILTDDVFINLEDFIAWMKGWLQPLKRLPEHVHQSFAEEVGFRFIQYPSIQDPDGSIHFEQTLWLVKGSLGTV